MPGKITKYFRIHSAKQFYEQFGESEPSNLYFFIARPYSWDNELVPPTPIDSTNQSVYYVWDNIMALKKISPADVSFGIDRTEWVSGRTYTQYTSDTEFFEDNDFYVITEDYNVYKCLNNNNASPSTIKPYGTSPNVITYADGYIWKYMYTVTASDALKFSTTRMIPTQTLTANNGSFQWEVQQSAVKGTIDTVIVQTGGSNYKEHTGTIVSGGTTTASLPTTANSINDIYTGSTIYITSGSGSGQLREITDYNGASRTITVNSSFSPSTDGTSAYVISPKVAITGDGSDAKAYSRVSGSSISKIDVINPGSDYTYANVTLSASVGSGATASPQLAPYGGHGKNAVDELFAHNIIMNVKMTGSEANSFIIANDFRVVGIIADPLENDNSVATDTVYDQTLKLTLSNPSNTFAADELVTGQTSGATAYAIEYFTPSILSLTGGNKKEFANGEVVKGGTTNATATIDSIKLPDLKKYEGRLLYVENRSPVSRSLEQTEDVKIYIRF